ncbi:NAD-dependent succinate-semialdehyde dehydrogenase [Oecophyllibacter saccharovorans]|uniref:NAD-dependent succinate-semialdehyde dehydrogenase n=1 Tax=Oecophyllibacter saccharovorans TaxID=2558360 RepID=UPI001173A88F|nr:NAD-dependent succinate-semialdehyde dehydrogenase [Oecophyllibacter saccharovorans]TPW35410.1 NAD-dependent succinate-semialdehyde dehydrogenase [Oecophyllibacter saccharovorans]
MMYATTNPYTGEQLKTFPDATDAQIDQALSAGHKAFLTWRKTDFAERARLMTAVATLLRQECDTHARLITLEMGKLFAEAQAEVILAAEIFEYYARYAQVLLNPQHLPVATPQEGHAWLVAQPLGILFAVEPWNFPYYQLARISAPQLSAGNVMLVKHSSNVPQCAAAFEALLQKAGLPAGLYQNLYLNHGSIEKVLNDPRVCGVALTGSERAGRIVGGIAGNAGKKATLELGGADAFIVLDDADVEKTARWAAFGRHWNAGQVCVSSKRLIVMDGIYDRFVAAYKAEVAKLKAGDPMDPATTLAPLSSQKAKKTLQAQVDQAVAEGATVEPIGSPVPEKGAFFRPLLMSGLEGKEARHLEFFGPVTQIYRVATEQEAIERANDSPYGLGGSVFTRDTVRGVRVANQVETGMMFVNHPTMVKADLPFGGIKGSGFGRELIGLGINEFVNHKLIDVVDIDAPF